MKNGFKFIVVFLALSLQVSLQMGIEVPSAQAYVHDGQKLPHPKPTLDQVNAVKDKYSPFFDAINGPTMVDVAVCNSQTGEVVDGPVNAQTENCLVIDVMDPDTFDALIKSMKFPLVLDGVFVDSRLMGIGGGATVHSGVHLPE